MHIAGTQQAHAHAHPTEKQIAQWLDWAILLAIKHAACLIMLDRSTSTHQHDAALVGPTRLPVLSTFWGCLSICTNAAAC